MTGSTKYYISDHCVIRNKQVIQAENLLFSGSDAEPAKFFTETYKHFGISYPKFYKMDNLCKLGFLASEILLKEKNLPYKGEDIGIVLSNAASSMDTDRVHQRSINDRTSYFPSPSVFVYTLPNIVIGEICIRNKITGEGAFFISESFDTGLLHGYVKNLLDNGIVQCCLAGWLELDGDQYEGILFMVEKAEAGTDKINVFDVQKLNEIYGIPNCNIAS